MGSAVGSGQPSVDAVVDEPGGHRAAEPVRGEAPEERDRDAEPADRAGGVERPAAVRRGDGAVRADEEVHERLATDDDHGSPAAASQSGGGGGGDFGASMVPRLATALAATPDPVREGYAGDVIDGPDPNG